MYIVTPLSSRPRIRSLRCTLQASYHQPFRELLTYLPTSPSNSVIHFLAHSTATHMFPHQPTQLNIKFPLLKIPPTSFFTSHSPRPVPMPFTPTHHYTLQQLTDIDSTHATVPWPDADISGKCPLTHSSTHLLTVHSLTHLLTVHSLAHSIIHLLTVYSRAHTPSLFSVASFGAE